MRSSPIPTSSGTWLPQASLHEEDIYSIDSFPELNWGVQVDWYVEGISCNFIYDSLRTHIQQSVVTMRTKISIYAILFLFLESESLIGNEGAKLDS